ncbi:MAG: hypothetical protein LBV12_06670 [Puniceicoccales bacterium]|nr:hypothetical protein [Puniceicoccales bacterium]
MKIRKVTNLHDEGLLGELEQPLRSGLIRKTDDLDEGVALVNQRFPFVLNRIDWEKMPEHLLLPAVPKTSDEAHDPDRYFTRRAPEFRAFIEDITNKHGIAMQTPVLFMGDSVSFVLRMTLAVLTEYSPKLFSYPQHVYVIPERADWCLSYTFEDDFLFGFAPKRNEPTNQR